MVKGYEEEGEKVEEGRLAKLKRGAVKAGIAIRKAAQKFQEARIKFYGETLPKLQKDIGSVQVRSTADVLGLNDLIGRNKTAKPQGDKRDDDEKE